MNCNGHLDIFRKWCFEKPFLSFRQGAFERPTGKNQFIHISHKDSQDTRELVCVVHATGNDLIFPFLSLFKDILDAGFDLLAFDLDGHGYASTSLYDNSQLTGCLPAAMEIPEIMNYEKIHIVAQSLGGVLSILYASQNPERLKSLSLVSVPTKLEISIASILSESLSLVTPSFISEAMNSGFFSLLPAVGSFRRQQYPFRLTEEATQKGLTYTDEVKKFINHSFTLKEATKITVPTLLCYGKLDQLSPASQGRELEKSIPRSKLVVSPYDNHFTSLLSGRLNQAILQHLKEHADA